MGACGCVRSVLAPQLTISNHTTSCLASPSCMATAFLLTSQTIYWLLRWVYGFYIAPSLASRASCHTNFTILSHRLVHLILVNVLAGDGVCFPLHTLQHPTHYGSLTSSPTSTILHVQQCSVFFQQTNMMQMNKMAFPRLAWISNVLVSRSCHRGKSPLTFPQRLAMQQHLSHKI